MKHNCFIAALALVFASAVGTAVQAAPPVNLFPAVTAGGPIKAEEIRCNCGHRYHRRRLVRVIPDAYVPVYPAPPVGLTFRKLFDAGYF